MGNNMLPDVMRNNMLLVFILGSMILLTSSTMDSQNRILRRCLPSGDKCYTLYRADLTWQQAYDACLSRNQHLATIQDAQTQSIMEEFAKDQAYPDPAHAWVAGRRSDDMTWRDLDGAVFNHDGEIYNDGDTTRLCMLMHSSPGYGSNGGIRWAISCHYKKAYAAVCEYDPKGRGCPDDDVTIQQPSVNKCNTVSSMKYQSWYDARQYCQSQGWQLAHTGAGSWDFYNKLTHTDKLQIKDNEFFWIGVQRRPWVWIINDAEGKYPGTTYWHSPQGGYSTKDCMHIELNDNGLWADEPCNETTSYFVCEQDQDQTTNTTVYIIVGVAGGVVVVIIIIVAVVCARRRRKENSSPNTTAATEVENPPQTDIGDDPQPYAEVRQFNNSPKQYTPEDPSSPYPLYDEAAAVRIDRIPTPELYYKAADEKDPMAPGFTWPDTVGSSGGPGPSQIVTNDGDIYSLPVKKSSLKHDDDLEIIDNPTYGAA